MRAAHVKGPCAAQVRGSCDPVLPMISPQPFSRCKFPQRPGAAAGRHGCGRTMIARAAGSEDGGADASTDEPPSIGDWRAFRSRLVASTATQSADDSLQTPENMAVLQQQLPYLHQEGIWAESCQELAPGMLLVARPEAPQLMGDPRLEQLVLLVLRHDDAGSEAVILNRPSAATVGDLLGWGLVSCGRWGRAEVSAPGLVGAFAGSTVYLGGIFPPNRIARQQVVFIHGMADLYGCTEVSPGVYRGGEAAAASRVLEGSATPLEFRFSSGALEWQPGQLEREVENGIWEPAKCSRSIALKACWQLPVPLWVEVRRLLQGSGARGSGT